MSLWVWLCGLFSLIIVRNVLESFSGRIPLPEEGTHLLHYPFALVVALLALVLLLAAFSGLPVVKPTRLILYPWSLILLPPLIDLLLPGAPAKIIGYVPATQKPGWVFFAFFNPWAKGRLITAGVRIEYLIGCLLAAVYIYHYGRSLLRAVGGFLCIYVVAVALAMKPGLYLTLFDALGVEATSRWVFLSDGSVVRHLSNRYSYSLALIDVFNLTALLVIWLRVYSRRLWTFCWREARLHEPLAAAVGVWAGARAFYPEHTLRQAFSHPLDVFAALALVLAPLMLVMAARHLGSTETRRLGVVELLLGLSAALCVHYAAFAVATALLGVLLLVEHGPFRAVRLPVVGAVGRAAALVSAGLLGLSLLHRMDLPRTVSPAMLGVVLILGAVSHLLTRWRVLRWPLLVVAVGVFFWSSSAPRRVSPQAIALGYRAQAFERDYEFRHAIEDYSRAVELGADEPEFLYSLAFLKAQDGSTDEALELYERLLDTQPNNSRALYQKGRLMESKGADPEPLYRQALGIAPDMEEALRSLGMRLLRRGAYEEALANFRELARLAPLQALPHNGAGLALQGMGRLDEAEDEHRAALSLDPGDPLLRLNLVKLLTKRSKLHEAREEVEPLLTNEGLSLDAMLDLSEVLQTLGETRRSLALCRELVARGEDDYPIHLRCGVLVDRSGRRKEGRALFRKAAELRPESLEPLHNLGVSYLAEGALDEARTAFLKAADLSPTDPSPWYHLAVVEALAGRSSEAAVFLERAISLGGRKYAQMAEREEALRRLPLEWQAQTPGFKSQIPGKLQ